MGKNADVEYILRANDEHVEGDLKEANKKVEKYASDSADKTVEIEEKKTAEIKKENAKVARSAENSADEVSEAWKEAGQDSAKAMEKFSDSGKEAADKVEDSFGDIDYENIFSSFKASASDSFKSAVSSAVPFGDKLVEITNSIPGLNSKIIGIGTAFAAVAAVGVGSAVDMDGAMNQFIASTGKSKEEAERYQGVLEKIYANNYGDDFEDIANSMSLVTKNMGEMDDSKLQEVTESAYALRDVFGYDIQETTRAANALMQNFGLTGEEAMNYIANGAQNGLDYSGELLDSISEYSVQFEKVGFSADDMFKIMEAGAENGAWNIDKMGDAIKEFSIRAVDGSETTRSGFNRLGLDADAMAEKFAAGGETAREAFDQTIEVLANMEDPIEQNAAGVELFGTMWEDLGTDAVTALADIEDGVYGTTDAMNEMKDIKYDDLGSMFEGLKRSVELLILPLGEALMPILNTLINVVLPVITDLITPLIDLVFQFITPIIDLINAAITPLIDIFISLMEKALKPLIALIENVLLPIFTGVFGSVLSTVTDIIGRIKDIFSGILSFIKNVFKGDWKAAWEDVKGIFGNIWEGMKSLFKAPINWIIDGINKFIGGLNKIKVPDWVPGVGGKGFNIKKIPRLKVGIDYVPSDFFPAFLDEGEMVLTKQQATDIRTMGGIENILSMNRYKDVIQSVPFAMPSVSTGNESKEYVFNTTVELDGRQLAKGTSRYMDEELATIAAAKKRGGI